MRARSSGWARWQAVAGPDDFLHRGCNGERTEVLIGRVTAEAYDRIDRARCPLALVHRDDVRRRRAMARLAAHVGELGRRLEVLSSARQEETGHVAAQAGRLAPPP